MGAVLPVMLCGPRALGQADGKWVDFGPGQLSAWMSPGSPSSNVFVWSDDGSNPVIGLGMNALSDGFYLTEWDGRAWTQRRLAGVEWIDRAAAYQGGVAFHGSASTDGGPANNGVYLWRRGEVRRVTTPFEFGTARALVEHQGQLILGGSFFLRGQRCTLAAWSEVDGWRPIGIANGEVSALTVWNDEVIAGGSFTSIDAVPAASLAAWDGTSWRSITPSSPSLDSLAVHDGQLCASSRAGFASPDQFLAQLDDNGDAPIWRTIPGGPINVSASSSAPMTLASYQGRLVVAGRNGSLRNPGQADIPSWYTSAWDGSTWLPLGGGLNGRVYALAAYRNELYIGGEFTIGASRAMSRVAKWDGQNLQAVGDGLGGHSLLVNNERVRSLIPLGDRLVAAGNFQQSGSTTTGPLVRWDGQTWSRFSQTNIPGNSNSVAPTMIVTAGGVTYGYGPAFASTTTLYRLDGDRWLVDTPNIAFIRSMIEYRGELLIAGWFNSINGQPISVIARRTPSGWVDMRAGFTPIAIFAAAEYRGDLIVAHWHGTVGDGRSNVSRWDGERWHAMPGAPQYPDLLLRFGGELIAANTSGLMLSGDQFYSCVARWDGHAWRHLAGGIQGEVNALAVFRGDLYIGGRFRATNNGTGDRYLARWTRCLADVDDGSGAGVADGAVTVDDLVYFLGLYELGWAEADLDDGDGLGTPDGGVTIDDLVYYLERYALGC